MVGKDMKGTMSLLRARSLPKSENRPCGKCVCVCRNQIRITRRSLSCVMLLTSGSLRLQVRRVRPKSLTHLRSPARSGLPAVWCRACGAVQGASLLADGFGGDETSFGVCILHTRRRSAAWTDRSDDGLPLADVRLRGRRGTDACLECHDKDRKVKMRIVVDRLGTHRNPSKRWQQCVASVQLTSGRHLSQDLLGHYSVHACSELRASEDVRAGCPSKAFWRRGRKKASQEE